MANLRRATQDNRPQAPFLPTAFPPPTSPLDFPLIFLVTYNNYMPVSTHTWPFKWATPRKLATPCWFSSLSLSLSLSLLAKNIFMAATHKSQKVPNVICLPFLFAFFHAVYFCLGAINPFLLLFRL